MAINNQIEVTIVDGFLVIKNVSNPNSVEESYNLAHVTSVNKIYQDQTALRAYRKEAFEFDEVFEVSIDIEENPTDLVKIKFDIQNVTNQPTWTADLAGLEQAVSDIKTAVSSVVSGGGGSAVATVVDTGNKTVAVAGTAESLVAVSTASKNVIITALETNTNTVVVGGSNVVAAIGTREGTPLEPGDSVDIPVDDLQKIFLDVEVAGEGVSFTYFS